MIRTIYVCNVEQRNNIRHNPKCLYIIRIQYHLLYMNCGRLYCATSKLRSPHRKGKRESTQSVSCTKRFICILYKKVSLASVRLYRRVSDCRRTITFKSDVVLSK